MGIKNGTEQLGSIFYMHTLDTYHVKGDQGIQKTLSKWTIEQHLGRLCGPKRPRYWTVVNFLDESA